jgi:hypothetical protein
MVWHSVLFTLAVLSCHTLLTENVTIIVFFLSILEELIDSAETEEPGASTAHKERISA